MEVDLVYRVLYLKSKGEYEPIERFNKWLKQSEKGDTAEFIVENEKYYWTVISSLQFNDIIHEDLTDWFLIYSENFEFKAIGKKLERGENLIGQKTEPYIPTLWILNSNIESLKVGATPINIRSPHYFNSTLTRINYDFRQLITKLRDPKIGLTENVDYKMSKSGKIRIR